MYCLDRFNKIHSTRIEIAVTMWQFDKQRQPQREKKTLEARHKHSLWRKEITRFSDFYVENVQSVKTVASFDRLRKMVKFEKKTAINLDAENKQKYFLLVRNDLKIFPCLEKMWMWKLHAFEKLSKKFSTKIRINGIHRQCTHFRRNTFIRYDETDSSYLLRIVKTVAENSHSR